MSDYANPDALVSTEWLADNLDNPNIRIIEVDEDVEAYTQGHIRNALGWDWSVDLHHPVRRDYIDQEGFSRLLSKAGVDRDTTVVLYGGNNNWFAAYAYWLLKYRGFDNVRLLNGGRQKWELEARELVPEVPPIDKSDFQISGASRPELRALRDEVLSKVGSVTFVDVRSPEEVHRREAGTRSSAPGAALCGRPRAGGQEHSLDQGRQRRRDVQNRRGATGLVSG